MEEICFPELVIPQGSFTFSFPVWDVWESPVHLAQPLIQLEAEQAVCCPFFCAKAVFALLVL